MLQQRALFPSVKKQDKRDQVEQTTAVTADTGFEVIFETYYTRIFKYIRFRVDCDYTAEDLTSQVFEKGWTRYGTFRADRSPIEVWLIAIARNTVNDYYRKQQRRKWYSLDLFKESPSREQRPEDRTLVREAETEMSRALQMLKPLERHVIALKFGAGLKNVQIAEFTDLSESHVGVMLFRATKKLKLELERKDRDG
ncbi:sigma-70 family RNA polymerase sigma factor [Paenibacillus sp. MBLB2552]|uniref:Sigma-70 family RNA polymerase sigma factor n=1 Tax=Paenibacillus mellifer TaxID=2937794 RepID=A0A9X2BPL1_9BACL|nr:sigma-70 family RNA polymerase sigma factor [Paenibacillus mellifer]MCK8487338.1 sigma-70 family RNA polymerase sigma factor [Paenibacillus mellifer]